ncbi:thiamine pyrophosphate-binding protein [Oceanibium sediminis]|uniref:thiamine pyrophosphate-binding protein n=1 Tax=Oceanibium sediminis TaxID=2026339 RepID=UPI000DD480ED|nr:thiamine pyrophosphate-binding protein [Oceanibium sediminis]
MSDRTGGRIIGDALRAAGATHAFGIPGGEVLALMQGLDDAGLRFVLVKHENAGGFMAEGLWHATGAPGVLVATLGPGVANAVNVVANAHQDKVPLIFLTGCVDAAEAESYTHQVFDHQQLLRPITKASFRASHGAVAEVMAKAIAIATSGQPGPVHVDVPISVAEATSDAADIPPHLPGRVAPAGRRLDTARKALAAARRPLAIAGVDAVNQGAGPAIRAWCDRNEVPLITTYKAKGLIDEGERLALGGAGLSPKADNILKPLIEASDCILLLGYDPIEMRIGWRNPWRADQTVIELTEVPRTHGMHSVSHMLTASVREGLSALGDVDDPEGCWPDRAPEAAKASLAQAFAPSGWGPGQVFATLRQAMPDTTVISADSGAHRILLSQMWQCRAPRGMIQSTALCTMACAVPLAAGFKLGAPDTPVIAFVGDAGLEMGLGELATIRDLGLPLIIVVLVDESLALIELKQRGTQRPNLGVDFGATDFPAVATALGGHGVLVEDAAALADAARAALQRDTFTVIAARIGPRAYDGAF